MAISCKKTPDATIAVVAKTHRIPSKGINVLGRKGPVAARKITITAHIDAKQGSPGALDNATGVTVLLLLAEALKNYEGPHQLELIALNGEDDYAVPGQLTYLAAKKGDFSDILLNINIDGVGLHQGKTAVTLFNLPTAYQAWATAALVQQTGVEEAAPWFQGDHSLFLQQGVPAIAFSSDWLLKQAQNQNITHTERDNLSIVAPYKLVELSTMLATFLQGLLSTEP